RHTRSYGDWSSDVCSSDLFPGYFNPFSERKFRWRRAGIQFLIVGQFPIANDRTRTVQGSRRAQADMTPQVIMILAIHMRAPNFFKSTLLGTSKKKYPIKKMPAPFAKAASLRDRSLSICSFAKPTFTRSR